MNLDVPEPQPVPAVMKSPRPFAEIPPLWLQLPHMNEKFFAAELPHASGLNTLLSISIYTVVGTIVVVLVGLLQSLVGETQASSAIRTTTLVVGCLTVFTIPFTFYLNTGMNYGSALIFGGKGKFNDQAYLASLFIVPIGFISSAISFLALIPVVGPFIEWPLLLIIVVISTVLQYRVVKVVHSLSSGRAAAAVLAPLVLIFGLLCLSVGVIFLLMVMGPMIGNTFSSINQSLLTPAP